MKRSKRHNLKKHRDGKPRKWETPEDRAVLHENLLVQLIRERTRAQQRADFTNKSALNKKAHRQIKHMIWLEKCYA